MNTFILCKLGIHTREVPIGYSSTNSILEKISKEYESEDFVKECLSFDKILGRWSIDGYLVRYPYTIMERRICLTCGKVFDDIEEVKLSTIKDIKKRYKKRVQYQEDVKKGIELYESFSKE